MYSTESLSAFAWNWQPDTIPVIWFSYALAIVSAPRSPYSSLANTSFQSPGASFTKHLLSLQHNLSHPDIVFINLICLHASFDLFLLECKLLGGEGQQAIASSPIGSQFP